jgi:gliding motility-associated-like protein
MPLHKIQISFFALIVSLNISAQQSTIGGIINNYTPVQTLNSCNNKITVEDASAFNPGDTVVMVQMKGAIINLTNTAAFGTITDYKNAGAYEFNYIKSISGNTIELKNKLTRQYDIPTGKVQLVKVPYYQNANVSSLLTCLPWDGNKGGILVLIVQDMLVLNADIDVGGKGFKGGIDPLPPQPSYFCYENQYFYPTNPFLASEKGEGIAVIPSNQSFGKGASANGGGSGNSHNSGAAGGGNGGKGGHGGHGYEGPPCNTIVPFANGGIEGNALSYSNSNNKIFLGGGAGAGQTNSGVFQANGGNGAGIIIIISNRLQSNNKKIRANGADAPACGNTGPDCHEGMGGGGAGGTVLLQISNYTDNTIIEAKGGKGADMTAINPDRIGPGGGGGGITWLTNISLPANVISNISGGQNGVCTDHSNDPWGSTPGQSGFNLFGLQIPIDNVLFKPNIDSVRISETLIRCDSFDFKGLGYTNTSPIATWNWDFGDGGSAITQNAGHSFAPGNYIVKLVVTDINGCKDSLTRNIISSFLTADAGAPDTICAGNSTVLQAGSTGANQYLWTSPQYLDDPTALNPLASPPQTTTFYLTATNPQGCSLTDSVKIEVRQLTNFTINTPASICKNDSARLNASGGDRYAWTPASTLDNAAIYNPLATPLTTTIYSVVITDTVCDNTITLSTTISVNSLPNVKASKTNDIDCTVSQSQLNAVGAFNYTWIPGNTLNRTDIPNPIANPVSTTQYVVKGVDPSGCANYDSVIVNVSSAKDGVYMMASAFTPDNNGINDCYGIKYWGIILELEFSIYNRWGERIFFTRNPGECWNGFYKGVPQDPAVFVYMIKAKTTCRDYIFRKGTFVLIR